MLQTLQGKDLVLLLLAGFHFNSPSLQDAKADCQSEWDAREISIVEFRSGGLISIS